VTIHHTAADFNHHFKVNPSALPAYQTAEPNPVKRKVFYRQLYFWVLVGMALGIVTGYLYPEKGAGQGDFVATQLRPFSTAFIQLIRMIIAPIIFTTVVVGMAGMNNLKSVGRIGIKAFFYFEVMTTFALFLGWVVAKTFHPGAGMNIDPAQLDVRDLQTTLAQAKAHPDLVHFVLNIIPKTLVGAFAEGDILQVLLVSVLFGIALAGLGEANRPVINALDQISKALMRMIGMIIKLAPFAVFGAMSFTISKVGISSLFSLGKLLSCVLLTCLCFVFIVLGLLMRLNGLSIWKFVRYIRQELFVVFSTASSEPVFPRMTEKLEALGCSKPLVSLVLPSGYSFNLDGSSIYLTMGALFIAQACNVHLSFADEVAVLIVSLVTSKGAAAVVGSAFITLTATLASMKTIPVEGMVLILGVDWFLAEARAMTNLVGNGVATIVIAKWEKEFDQEKALRVLNGATPERKNTAFAGVKPNF
jgi:aerobic C4-dicarboxylate transport protein